MPKSIKQVGKFLAAPAEESTAYVQALQSLRYDVAVEVSEWHEKTARAKRAVLQPKDKLLTELDRSVNMEALAAAVQKDLLLLERLEVILADQFSFATRRPGS